MSKMIKETIFQHTHPNWKPSRETVQEYVGLAEVSKKFYAAATCEEIDRARKIRGYTQKHLHPDRPEYEIHFNRSRLFHIKHLPTNTWVGCDLMSVAHILEEHRHKGLMAQTYVAMDGISRFEPLKNKVRSLTPDSLGALCHAHALHVSRALNAGEAVPSKVMEQYAHSSNGMYRLKTPYDQDACNAYTSKTMQEQIAKINAERDYDPEP